MIISTATHGHGPPALPIAGKVIQPMPKGAIVNMEKEGTNGGSRPVWGRTGQGGGGGMGVGMSRVQNDFPTAAEAAEAAQSTSSFFCLFHQRVVSFLSVVYVRKMLCALKGVARRAELTLFLSVFFLWCIKVVRPNSWRRRLRARKHSRQRQGPIRTRNLHRTRR